MDYTYTTTNNYTPLTSALSVTPADGTDLVPPSGNARPTRGVLVGGAGNMTAVFSDGSTVLLTIPATACGVVLPIAVTRIRATGTTATLIIALY